MLYYLQHYFFQKLLKKKKIKTTKLVLGRAHHPTYNILDSMELKLSVCFQSIEDSTGDWLSHPTQAGRGCGWLVASPADKS